MQDCIKKKKIIKKTDADKQKKNIRKYYLNIRSPVAR